MHKTLFFITALGTALLISNPAFAKVKGHSKEKHQSQSSPENTNRQSSVDRYRGQERARMSAMTCTISRTMASQYTESKLRWTPSTEVSTA
ncbi:MAG: hypothetical protein ACXV7J_13450 [Methylomonas sp.]